MDDNAVSGTTTLPCEIEVRSLNEVKDRQRNWPVGSAAQYRTISKPLSSRKGHQSTCLRGTWRQNINRLHKSVRSSNRMILSCNSHRGIKDSQALLYKKSGSVKIHSVQSENRTGYRWFRSLGVVLFFER